MYMEAGNKKCGQEDVYDLVKESPDYEMFIQNFNEKLN